MKESDLTQARLNQIAGLMHQRIAAFCEGQPCDRATLEGVRDIVARFRQIAIQREGLDFPEMLVVMFARVGAIEVVRRDWTERDVRTWIVNLTVKYPTITPTEIAKGVQQAFPRYAMHVNADASRGKPQ